MSATRIGLIGFGAWGRQHASAIASLAGHELAGIADRYHRRVGGGWKRSALHVGLALDERQIGVIGDLRMGWIRKTGELGCLIEVLGEAHGHGVHGTLVIVSDDVPVGEDDTARGDDRARAATDGDELAALILHRHQINDAVHDLSARRLIERVRGRRCQRHDGHEPEVERACCDTGAANEQPLLGVTFTESMMPR